MSEFQELLDSITRLVGQVSGATSSLIIIQDDGEGERRRAYFNLTSKGVASIVANKDFFKMIERAEKPIFIENVLELPEHEHYNDIMPFIGKSLIAVPLIIEGERMGTLLAMHHDEFAFEPEDVSLLFAFANNITIAIDNARLYKKSLQQERYQRELRLAQDIQRRLLPESLPKVQQFDLAAYSSPAFEVGGDYYEAVELKNGNICLLVGDVSGKGISAALYMSVVKGIVLAIARESNSPKELLERINEAIFGEIDRQSYITAIALEIDPHRCSLRLARAGHTPLLLRRNDHVELLTPKGLGIGLMSASFFNSVLEEVEVEFGEDDACLLFSDGINEAVNARGEEFGLEAMKSIIALKTESAEMLLGNVLRSIIDFAKDTPQHDDITMVAVTCQKKQPPIS